MGEAGVAGPPDIQDLAVAATLGAGVLSHA